MTADELRATPAFQQFLDNFESHCGAPVSVFRGQLAKSVTDLLGKLPSPWESDNARRVVRQLTEQLNEVQLKRDALYTENYLLRLIRGQLASLMKCCDPFVAYADLVDPRADGATAIGDGGPPVGGDPAGVAEPRPTLGQCRRLRSLVLEIMGTEPAAKKKRAG
jgi:hypothetical protein